MRRGNPTCSRVFPVVVNRNLPSSNASVAVITRGTMPQGGGVVLSSVSAVNNTAGLNHFQVASMCSATRIRLSKDSDKHDSNGTEQDRDVRSSDAETSQKQTERIARGEEGNKGQQLGNPQQGSVGGNWFTEKINKRIEREINKPVEGSQYMSTSGATFIQGVPVRNLPQSRARKEEDETVTDYATRHNTELMKQNDVAEGVIMDGSGEVSVEAGQEEGESGAQGGGITPTITDAPILTEADLINEIYHTKLYNDLAKKKRKPTDKSLVSQKDKAENVIASMLTGDAQLEFLKPRSKEKPTEDALTREKRLDAMLFDPKTGDLNLNVVKIRKTKDKKEIAALLTQHSLRQKHIGRKHSKSEHPLLVDLDFQQDTLLFGTDPDEFESNVKKLRKIIMDYQDWEKYDKWYLWGTYFCMIACVWHLYQIFVMQRSRSVLDGNLQDFADITAEDIQAMQEVMRVDLDKVQKEIETNRPSFTPVVKTVQAERDRLNKIKKEREAQGLSSDGDDDIGEEFLTALGESGGEHPLDVDKDVEASAIMLQREEKATLKKLAERAKLDAAEAGSGRSLLSGLTTQREKSFVQTLLLEPVGWLIGQGTGKTEGDASSTTPGAASSAAAASSSVSKLEAKQQVKAKKEEQKRQSVRLSESGAPLTKEDYVQLSYAVSPTSIDSIRAMRRILLPKADDYLQVVREEMLEYREQKERAAKHL